MVRGPAALLTLVAGAVAYFAVAPSLPAITSSDTAIAVAGAVGLALVVALATVLVPVAGAPLALVPAVLGALLLVGACAAADAGAVATPVEAILCGCIGIAFAVLLDVPALAVALPLFVAALDVSGLVGGAPGSLLAGDVPAAGDPLTLELPAWGGGFAVVHLSVADVVFLAAYTTYARLFALRPRASAVAMYLALVAALLATLALDREVPALAAVSVAFLLANIDRIGPLLGAPREA